MPEEKIIELFGGVEKLTIFGNAILANEEYLKNYKYIKDNYGRLYFDDKTLIDILSDKNVERIGYENIFKFFNLGENSSFAVSQRFRNIPPSYTKEDLDKVIELYGTIPKFAGFYDPKIIDAIKKAKTLNISIDFDNEEISERLLTYIIENGLQDNIVTILNTDFSPFYVREYTEYGDYSSRFYYRSLHLMTSKMYEELGFENVVQISKVNRNIIGIARETQEKDLLSAWKSRIDSVSGSEKEAMYSIRSALLLDPRNSDLNTVELLRIIKRLNWMDDDEFEKLEALIKDNPEYIRLLEVPDLLLKSGRGSVREFKKGELESCYEEFQAIKRIIGNDNFLNLIDSVRYSMMQEAYKNGTLENWKKLLEIDKNYIPPNINFLNKHIFNNNSPQELMKLYKNDDDSSLDELRMVIALSPKFLFYIYTLEEMAGMWVDEHMAELRYILADKDFDNEIIALIQEYPNYKDYLKELIESYITATREMITKGGKFAQIAHFIPSLYVVKKYPIDQIEKFNKKIWFNFARYQLFNSDDNAKNALVEALLSFGVFEKDKAQKEKMGLLQKMATYLPKEFTTADEELLENDILKEHFEMEDKRVVDTVAHLNIERLLNDPNIVNLFNSKEEAKRELEKLPNILDDFELKEKLKIEYHNKTYKDIMDYIYLTGYDVYDLYEYKFRLKTDIQQAIIKDKKSGKKLEKDIRQLYYGIFDRGEYVKDIMSPKILHRIFDGMDMKYKEGFFEFFRDNYEQILDDPKKQSDISKIQKQWEKIVETYLKQKITFEKCQAYIHGRVYENVADDEKELARLAGVCGYTQGQFEEIQRIYREQLKRTKSSIPQIEKTNKRNGYQYMVLRLDDPVAIFIGELTGCCQALDREGESCMRHSVTSPNGRVLVVLDERGKVVSQSWLWRNKNVLCLDNVEAVMTDSNHKKIINDDIFNMVKQAAKDFVETDRKHLAEWKTQKIESLKKELEEGKLSKEQYEIEISKIDEIIKGQQLSKVTVGVGYTDIDLKGLEEDTENRYPEEEVEYINDSRVQMILYEDKTVENIKTDMATVALYSDSERAKYLVNVDTSEIIPYDEEEFDVDGEYYEEDDDEYYDDYEDLEDLEDYGENNYYYEIDEFDGMPTLRVLRRVIQDKEETNETQDSSNTESNNYTIKTEDIESAVKNVPEDKIEEAKRNIKKYLENVRGE